MNFWIFFFLGAAAASPYINGTEKKQQIEESRESAQKRLMEVMGTFPDINEPLRKLKELSAAGKADIDSIVQNYGNAMNRSVLFWSQKMEDVIRPYLVHPEAYLGIQSDLSFKSHDPKWNGSIQYKEVEKELDELVDSAIAKMQNEFDKRSGKPAESLPDITQASWRKLQGQKALDNAAFNIKLRKQWLKLKAAGGNTSEIPQFKSRVSSIADLYRRQLIEIYSS